MSRYPFQDSIRDKATLPLHFEATTMKLKIDKAAIDEAYKQTNVIVERLVADIDGSARKIRFNGW